MKQIRMEAYKDAQTNIVKARISILISISQTTPDPPLLSLISWLSPPMTSKLNFTPVECGISPESSLTLGMTVEFQSCDLRIGHVAILSMSL